MTPAAPPAPSPTARVWALLDRSVDGSRASAALVGLSPTAAHLMAAVLHATSPETDALLAAMPRLLRSLSVSSTARPERCHGGIRGPILWSETMAARAASVGAGDVVVCSIAERAYDTVENRLLVAALRSIVDAAADVRRASPPGETPTALVRRGQRNGLHAARYLENRALAGVDERRVGTRERRRVRTAKRARPYRPAVALLERAVSASDVAALTDPSTAAGHALLADVVETLRTRGHTVPPLRVRHGSLVGGPVTYVHPRARGAALAPGIHVGDVVLQPPLPTNRVEEELARAGF